MGDRYTITASSEALSSRFGVQIPEHYESRFNASPTQLLPIITQQSEGLSYFYWGQIPGWSNNKALSKKLIYADYELLLTRKSFTNSLKANRCIIPADSFFDWKRISKKGRVAHRYQFQNDYIKGLGGFWEEFEDESGEIHHTFKIIVDVSSAEFENQSNRAPMVVKEESEKIWLSDESDPEILMGCLKPLSPHEVHIYSVSPKIENVEIDSDELIKPFAPADQFGNYSLFD